MQQNKKVFIHGSRQNKIIPSASKLNSVQTSDYTKTKWQCGSDYNE